MERSWHPAILASALSLASVPAFSSEKWEAAASGAVAILPVPEKAKGISGGSLYCAEQRWSFLFRPDEKPPAGTRVAGKVTIGGEPFPVLAVETNGLLGASVPFEILEPLKSAARMGVAIGDGDTSMNAIFPLKASRAVIEAVAARCSPVDMSAYQRLALSETDPAVAEAERLLAGEAKLFRAATGLQPSYAAKLLELPDGGALLFASICGSNRYYGESGCSLAGFARSGAGQDWKPVYNTEGVQLHLDPATAAAGFPGIVALPHAGGAEPSHWVWNGSAYQIRDAEGPVGTISTREPAR
ncbi:hypothetical protein [Mesorhizobium sp. L-8-3]|uniref:hypothetical protein n=1 Tax=Mesorhizobium sp. L-8-3 TaxID=2744522 RepID=UPI0019279717|nr:hypothetical protein [Mesorhizobium sp. L-8-3]BCH22197.1 hypothetical protein MesoLjLb_19820 [Mesorhizobium sp. L-8-3]